jgi:hypothetical protein
MTAMREMMKTTIQKASRNQRGSPAQPSAPGGWGSRRRFLRLRLTGKGYKERRSGYSLLIESSLTAVPTATVRG